MGLSRVWLVLSFAFLCVFARGDGMFAKLGSGLARPGIPFQRAIVAHRDGVETLVVESTLDAPAGDYVWIVPVPKPPTRVMPLAEGAMDMMGLRPVLPAMQATDSKNGFRLWAGVWLVVLGLGVAFFGIDRTRSKLAVTMVAAMASGGVLGIVYAIPGAMAAKSAATAGSVVSVAAYRAGEYRVDVVRSDDSEDLAKWLAKRGGTLPDAAKKAVAAYVRDGWCFAVAQLRPHHGGRARPHPLALEFPTARPVYPMRLTGTQPGRLLLELFVVADGSAVVAPLRVWVSDEYANGRREGAVDEDDLLMFPLEAVAWKGAIVTRLRGEVAPEDMTRDYAIKIRPFHRERIRVIAANEVRELRRGWAVLGGGLALLIGATGVALVGLPLGRRMVFAFLLAGAAAGVSGFAATRGMEPLEPAYYLVPPSEKAA